MIFLFFVSGNGQVQSRTADLLGRVVEQSGTAVSGVRVSVENSSTGVRVAAVTDDRGAFSFSGLPPGRYEVFAEGTALAGVVVRIINLTIGQRAELEIPLRIVGNVAEVIPEGVKLIDSNGFEVSSILVRKSLEFLPIDYRSAAGLALTISTVGRDNGPLIGPAPTSGFNIGGQRGRSSVIHVDGVDFTDNSINAARSTVSQEAVEEFQITSNSYSPEFGRATGGIINLVTRSGSGDLSGSAFGFITDETIRADQPFAPHDDDNLRRSQWGTALGGPILNDRTFFFISFERRDTKEAGYFTSDPSAGLGNSIELGPPFLPFAQTFSGLTADQVAFAQALLDSGNPELINSAVRYLYLASSGTSTALTGSNPLISPGNQFPFPAGEVIGPRFLLSGAPVPSGAAAMNGEPVAFRPLNGLRRSFPAMETSNFLSIRGDHTFDSNNSLNFRVGWNKLDAAGLQAGSQNQSFGQNDFSRTGVEDVTDHSLTAAWNSAPGSGWANELKLGFARREAAFRSQSGDAVAFNVSGAAFVGREPFSPVSRSETRIQLADNVTLIRDSHIVKFGADLNRIIIPDYDFELNFAGVFNFGPTRAFFSPGINLTSALDCSPDPLNPLDPGCLSVPAFNPVQAYGLGIPSSYVQGFGNSAGNLKNTPMAFFAQDIWKVRRNLTFSYGIRYDVELTDQIPPDPVSDPLSGLSLSAEMVRAAQNAVKVQQGIPRDLNNWAPRIGFAIDLNSDGITVIRGAAGIYFDHPLLAVAANSDISDGSQQQQAVFSAGSPSPTEFVNAAQIFQGTVCVPGAPLTPVCAPLPSGTLTPGVASTSNYQFGSQRFDHRRFPGFGTILPVTFPVAGDFQYGSAVQASLGIEHRLTDDTFISVSYMFVGAHHLNRANDLNPPNVASQIENFRRCFGIMPISTAQAVSVDPSACSAPGGVFENLLPGIISLNTTTGEGVISPAVANFFRPNAPNYFLANALSGGAVTPDILNDVLAIANTLRAPGHVTPFGAVYAQVSDGNSEYNAVTAEMYRRLADNLTFRASYTWSHSFDDSADLHTTLLPQDAANLRGERGDSLFDQRHKFVFSGILFSPPGWRTAGKFWKRLMAGFAVAPVIEITSGRPFNILTGVDSNNDQSSQNDRPDVDGQGVLTVPSAFRTGSLGRNRGVTHHIKVTDVRVSRSFSLREGLKLDLIGEVFNLFNRFNEASASPFLFDVLTNGERSGGKSFFSRPTAAFNPREFQVGVRLSF